MKEAKKGQIIILKTSAGNIEGVISNAGKDRLEIFCSKDNEKRAYVLNEGDEIYVDVHTRQGIKSMKSIVICTFQNDGKLVIENSQSILLVVQKREHVRAAASFMFFIKTKGKLTRAKCVDISAGGIKFIPDEQIFHINEMVEIKFLAQEFGKNIDIKASILNVYNNMVVAVYKDLNEFDRSKIAGFCLSALGGAK